MEYQAAAEFIRKHTKHRPSIGIVTGSGLGNLADGLDDAQTISYADIPGFPQATVEGHKGELCLGTLKGKPVCIARGRVHFYEGYTQQQVTYYVRVLRAMGVEALVLTNAAGGLNTAFKPGDVMLIADHINLLGMSGFNPLHGPNDPAWGPRFPSLNPAYDPSLRAIAREVAGLRKIALHEGIYVAVSGPSFETAAELRMLRMLGGDAVGMSTANETVVAVHSGMRVLGLSLITNLATGDPAGERFTAEELHHEVLDAGAVAVPKMIELISGIVARM